MAVNRWRGDAQPKRHILKGVINNIEAGDIFGVTCNRKDIQAAAPDTTIAATLNALKAAISGHSNTTEPEFNEITPVLVDSSGGANWEHILFYGPQDGTPITLTSYTQENSIAITVVRTKQGYAGRNEKQRINLTNATGGTFTLTFNGQTTIALAYNALGSTIQGQLEALSNIVPGDVLVTGGAGGPWVVEFMGNFANDDVALLTGNGTSLTQAGYSIRVDTITAGDVGKNEIQLVNIGEPTGGTFTLNFSGETTGNIAYNASAGTVQTALEALSNVANGDVTVTKNADNTYSIEFKQDYRNTNVPKLIGDGGSLTGYTYIQPYTTVYGAPNTNSVIGAIPNGVAHYIKIRDFAIEGTPWVIYGPFSAANMNLIGSLSNGNLSATVVEGTSPLNYRIELTGDYGGRFVRVGSAGYDLAVANEQLFIGVDTNAAADYTPYYPGTDDWTLSSIRSGSSSGVNAIQRIDFFGGPTGGDYTLTYEGQTTGAIAYNANAAAVQAALEALSNIDSGDVTVAGSLANGFSFTFGGNLAAQDITVLLPDPSGLTGNRIVITTTQDSAAFTNEQQNVTVVGGPQGGTFTLTFEGNTTSAIAYDATAAAVKTALEALATIGAGDLGVTKTNTNVYSITFRGTRRGENVPAISGDATSLTGSTVYITTVQTADLPVNDTQRVTVEGATGGTYTLTFGVSTSGPIVYNAAPALVESILEAMASIGAGNVAVSGSTGGPWDIEFSGTLGAAGQSLVTADSASLTSPGSQTFTITEIQEPTGPNWWSEPENWTLGHVPIDTETIVIDGAVPIKYGMDATGVNPATLLIMASFTGTIGLPDINEGGYYEYREKALKIGQTNTLLYIKVGEGEGNGSSFMRIDCLDAYPAVHCILTGAANDATGPALQLTSGTKHASAYVKVEKGFVGLAIRPGELFACSYIITSFVDNVEGDAVITIGAGNDLDTIIMHGGTVASVASGYALDQRRGNFSQSRDSYTLDSVSVTGGTATFTGPGTINGTTKIAGNGILSLERAIAAVSFANPVLVYGDSSEFADPNRMAIITGQTYMDINYVQTTRYEALGSNVQFRRTKL